MSNRAVVIYCGLLLTLSAFSIDIILPAFSLMARDLNTDYIGVQLGIPVFLASIGVGQLFVGSLSDRYGRRPVIMAGLAIFIVGSMISATAATIEIMLIGRVLQGVGNSVAPVVGRAIIRDLFEGEELARNLALATAVFAFGPIVAPLVGAAFMLIFPWPVLFVLMTVFGVFLLAVCYFWLPETLAKRDETATRPSKFIGNMKVMIVNPVSRFYLMMCGVIMSMMYIIISVSPRIYDENFGVTGALFAVLFAIHGFGIIVGQIANRKIISNLGVYRSAVIGNVILIIACMLMFGGSVAGVMNAYIYAGLFVLFATSFLIVYSNATALTLGQHGDIAGFASSFYGFTSQVVGSIIAVFAQMLILGNQVWFSGTLLAICLVIMVALLSRKNKDPV